MNRLGAPMMDEQHARQRRLDHPPHRPDIKIERKVPFRVCRIQHRAMMHEARAVEQDVGLRLGNTLFDRGAVAHIQYESFDVFMANASAFTSVANTLAPSLAMAKADARPIPCAAAVMIARFPASL